MQNTPKGLRLQIGIFGRRNVGKSSLLNAVTRQEVSIVSEFAGTTTDPVEKAMELLPIGPVLFIDTAGIDDDGDLGKLRIQKTHRIFDRIDIGIIVTEVNAWGSFEEKIYAELKDKKIPTVVVLNKSDIYELKKDEFKHFLDKNIPFEIISTKNDKDVLKFRQLLLDNVPESFINNPSIIQDIVLENEFAVLVTPIDKEAPKGRLILPEVQTIRDILDGNAYCVVTQQNQLARVLETLKLMKEIHGDDEGDAE